MASFKCVCGDQFSLSARPNRAEFWIYSDDGLNSIIGQLAHLYRSPPTEKPIGLTLTETLKLQPQRPQIIECPSCGRLHVLDKQTPFAPAALTYLPERRPENTKRSLNELFPELGDRHDDNSSS